MASSGAVLGGVLILCCALLLMTLTVWFAPKSKQTSTSSEDDILMITEDGASRQGGGASGTETYMIVGDPKECRRQDNKPAYCEGVGYDSETNGLTFFYDLGFDANSPQFEEECNGQLCTQKKACPGGGFDCAYTEKFDAEGSLVAIVNKNGDSLLDTIANDVWADKLGEDWRLTKEASSSLRYEDGKMFFTKSSGMAKAGDEFTLKLANSIGAASMYFIALLVKMKQAGESKPAKIVLDVAGAREALEKRIERESGYRSKGKAGSRVAGKQRIAGKQMAEPVS